MAANQQRAGENRQLTFDDFESNTHPPQWHPKDDDPSTCRDCGDPLPHGWHRVFAEDPTDRLHCRDCRSRTERRGTLELIGGRLDHRRDDVDPPGLDATPTDTPRTRLGGPTACRYCQAEFPTASRALMEHFYLEHVTPRLEIDARNSTDPPNPSGV